MVTRKLLVSRRSRTARRGEAHIAAHRFPSQIEKRVRRRFPELIGAQEESILWDLDQRLGIEQPLGLIGPQISSARTRSPYPRAGGWACAGGVAAGGDGNSGSCGAGGDGGGGSSGCGGGCGGGS